MTPRAKAKRKSSAKKAGSRMRAKARDIDEYLALLPEDQRDALQRLREIIHSAAPRAEECISYGMPAFRLDGRCFIYLGASSKHCAIYGAVGDMKELARYDVSKGTIRFEPDDPLPAPLVRKIVKARLAKNVPNQRSAAGTARRSASKSSGR